MSFTKRTFYFSKKIVELWRKKSIQNSLFLILSFFFCIGFAMNAYAYNPKDIYEEIDEFSNLSTGVTGKHSHKSQGFQMVDSITVLLDLTYPQGNENYPDIVNSPDISPGAKLGLVGSTEYAVNAILYNPPQIDVVEHLAMEWIPNYRETSGTVYASGYESLQESGISSLWQYTRNLAYALFVIVFIVAGFMIMFRHKLGGQTMVTIYNTLPGIVVGLILVTFSFAIVGLILDIGIFLTGVIANFFEIRTRMGHEFVDPTKPLGLWSTYSDQVAPVLTYGGGPPPFSDGISGLVGLPGWFANQALSKVLGGLAGLVFAFIFIYAALKIFITLIKTYVAILIDTVLAPLVLAIGTIPGRQGMTKDWLNRIFKNVSVFVLVFLLVNLPLHLWQARQQNWYGGIEGWDYRFNLFEGELIRTSALGSIEFVGNIIMASVGVYLLFLAANAPKLLEPLFPQTGAKGGAGAAEGAARDLSKIPGVGGFFKK
jgi:hypothetical protein